MSTSQIGGIVGGVIGGILGAIGTYGFGTYQGAVVGYAIGAPAGASAQAPGDRILSATARQEGTS